MKCFALTIACAVGLASPAAAKSVTVKGSFRPSGTYVMPHVRTAPNSTRADNWSSKPNVNPYNGRQGTVNPYAPPKLPRY